MTIYAAEGGDFKTSIYLNSPAFLEKDLFYTYVQIMIPRRRFQNETHYI
jgi:hypothetical protein